MAIPGARQLVTPPPPPGVSRFEGVWVYDTTTTMADPGAGKVRSNNTTSASVTQLAISRLGDSGTDYTNILRSLKANDTVYIQDQDTAANFSRYQLTAAATDNITWFLLPVSYVSSGGVTPGNNARLLLSFSQTGAAGGGGAAGPVPFACQGRLTTETGVPVSAADRLAQATLYFTPYRGGYVSLYVAGAWTVQTFTQASLSLAGVVADKNYDVFIFPSGATVGLELGSAWTSDTVRADALGTQDGIFVKASDHSRLWVGIIRAAAAGQTEDSKAKRFVANYYQRVGRVLEFQDNQTRQTTSTAFVQVGPVQLEYLSTGEVGIRLLGNTQLSMAFAGERTAMTIGSGPTTQILTATIAYINGIANNQSLMCSTMLDEMPPAGYTVRYLLFRTASGGNAYCYGGTDNPPAGTTILSAVFPL